jgi:hypothetical protein
MASVFIEKHFFTPDRLGEEIMRRATSPRFGS